MGIVRNALKAIWNSLQQPYDPLNPAPEVREKLEQKGYRFQFDVYNAGRMVVKKFRVTNPQGEPVACHRADTAATQKYVSDYNAAEAECRAAAEKGSATAPTPPQP